ncbi:hypothetical protein SEEGA711_24955 [Salmonella enterica subsp. enterica serovar Gaminara str. ATCC BAA-711]|nr:hypothetical protein SEEGA711_24955 [Salmonella enterica subsp. enterica serovar Gaminara str. ATCC BAA-711]
MQEEYDEQNIDETGIRVMQESNGMDIPIADNVI